MPDGASAVVQIAVSWVPGPLTFQPTRLGENLQANLKYRTGMSGAIRPVHPSGLNSAAAIPIMADSPKRWDAPFSSEDGLGVRIAQQLSCI
jgi:hypothetical protein